MRKRQANLQKALRKINRQETRQKILLKQPRQPRPYRNLRKQRHRYDDMAIIRKRDLRGMGDEELNAKNLEIAAELSREKGSVAAGTKAESPGKIRELRKTIARIMTLKNERASAASLKNSQKQNANKPIAKK